MALTSLLQVALAYAERRWPVFPLEPKGKQPLGRLAPHGYKDATTDLEKVRAWWTDAPDANIGIPTGIAFDVADLDSEAAMKRFLAVAREHDTEVKALPRARTGGGGRHVLFAPTSGIGNKAGVMPEMDWRGKGGYIVAPGSIHASGERYEWIVEPNGHMPPCPEWLLALLRPEKPAAAPSAGPASIAPPAYVDAAIEAEMATLRRSKEGERNDALNQAAFALGQLCGAGWLHRPRAESELRAAAYAIGLQDPEVLLTIRSGMKAGHAEPRTPPPGGFGGGSSGGEIRKGQKAAPPTAEIYSMADLEGMDIPEPRAIVPGVIHAGLNMLVGKGKLGKSWLALSTSIAIATGGKALGSLPVEEGEVLYLALEDNKRRMQDRAQQLLGKARFPAAMYVAHTWPKLDEGGMEKLQEWLTEHPKASLVIIDVWKRLRPKRVRGASLYDEDYEHLVPLQALALKFDIAVLIVHHTRKATAEDVFDEISGSGGVLAALDACIVLHRSRSEADGEIWVTGRDVEESHLALHFEEGRWTLLGEAGNVWRSKERRAVIDAVTGAGRPVTPAEVADILGQSRNKVRQLIFKMHSSGDLARLPNSTYSLPVTPVTAITGVTAVTAVTGGVTGVTGVTGVIARPRARRGCPKCGTLAYAAGPLPGSRRCHKCGETYDVEGSA